MNKKQVVEHLCGTMGLAYHTIGDYTYPCDCVCLELPDSLKNRGLKPMLYQNHGEVLKFVRQAVVEKLEREGYTQEQMKKAMVDDFDLCMGHGKGLGRD